MAFEGDHLALAGLAVALAAGVLAGQVWSGRQARAVGRLLERLVTLQQLAWRGSVTDEQRRQVTRFLLQSGYFADRVRRDLLLLTLPTYLTGQMRRSDAAALDLPELVSVVLRWGRGADVALFMQNVADVLNGSPTGDAWAALRRTLDLP